VLNLLLFIGIWEAYLFFNYVRQRFGDDPPNRWIIAGLGSYLVGYILWWVLVFDLTIAVNEGTIGQYAKQLLGRMI